jgi:AcrR family transcriptional regulator
MPTETRAIILKQVLHTLLSSGPEQVSMRQIADQASIQQSVLYYHFKSKEDMLKQAFLLAQQQIREALEQLPPLATAPALLRQRIVYHLQHGHLIIPMLRYFMAIKQAAPQEPGGYIPPQAYRHIREAIELGIEQGVYRTDTIDQDAKVIVHALNGFVMEYYPDQPYSDELIDSIQSFIERGLQKGGG